MRAKPFTHSLLFFIACLWIAACTDAPVQYDRGSAIWVDWEGNPIPTGNPIQIPELPAEKPDDEIARENSLKPIHYGVGAAGITFKTTLPDSQKLLSKPYFGPRPSDGLAAYYSGIYVWWRVDKPRTPQIILVNSGYQGGLDTGEAFGEIKLGHDFSSHFTAQDPKGEALVVKLFNTLEKIEDPKFSCLEEKLCEVVESENDLVLSWSKIGFLVSKDRKVLYRMMLVNKVAQGKLDNDFDMVSGTFAVPAGEGQPTQNLGIGKSWGEILGSIKINPDTDVQRDLFFKDYSGIVLGLNKSHYEREYTEPEANEALKVVAVYSGFQKKLKVQGQYVLVTTDGEELKLQMVSTLPEELGENTFPLELKLNLDKRYHTRFVHAFSDLLLETLKSAAPEALVFKMLSGFHEDTDQKEYGASIVQFDPESGMGKRVIFEVRESTGNVGMVEILRLDEPLDKIIVPTAMTPVVPEKKTLGGFTLGQTLVLQDTDTGREETTISIARPDSEPIHSRATYIKNGLLQAVFEGGKLESQRVEIVRLGNLQVSLGVVEVANENAVSTERTVKVVSISSSNNVAGVTGLCGLSGFTVKPGQKDTVVKGALDKAIAAARAQNPEFVCEYHFEEDPNATNIITGIYFPEDRTKISFSKRELSSTTLYTRIHEVQR